MRENTSSRYPDKQWRSCTSSNANQLRDALDAKRPTLRLSKRPFSRAPHERERHTGLVGPGQKKIGPCDGSYLSASGHSLISRRSNDQRTKTRITAAKLQQAAQFVQLKLSRFNLNRPVAPAPFAYGIHFQGLLAPVRDALTVVTGKSHTSIFNPDAESGRFFIRLRSALWMR